MASRVGLVSGKRGRACDTFSGRVCFTISRSSRARQAVTLPARRRLFPRIGAEARARSYHRIIIIIGIDPYLFVITLRKEGGGAGGGKTNSFRSARNVAVSDVLDLIKVCLLLSWREWRAKFDGRNYSRRARAEWKWRFVEWQWHLIGWRRVVDLRSNRPIATRRKFGEWYRLDDVRRDRILARLAISKESRECVK